MEEQLLSIPSPDLSQLSQLAQFTSWQLCKCKNVLTNEIKWEGQSLRAAH